MKNANEISILACFVFAIIFHGGIVLFPYVVSRMNFFKKRIEKNEKNIRENTIMSGDSIIFKYKFQHSYLMLFILAFFCLFIAILTVVYVMQHNKNIISLLLCFPAISLYTYCVYLYYKALLGILYVTRQYVYFYIPVLGVVILKIGINEIKEFRKLHSAYGELFSAKLIMADETTKRICGFDVQLINRINEAVNKLHAS